MRGMDENEQQHGDDAGEQQIQLHGLDGGGGGLSVDFGADWVAYLASADLPANVTGVDHAINHFGEGEQGGTAYA